MRARSAAAARQHGQQAVVMAQYNRERVAVISSNNNNNNHNNTNLQQMNITEGRSNYGINLFRELLSKSMMFIQLPTVSLEKKFSILFCEKCMKFSTRVARPVENLVGLKYHWILN